jgi:hypothetical protein
MKIAKVQVMFRIKWEKLRKITWQLEPGLPTNFKNFLLDQPKNSAAGEKVRPPQNIYEYRSNLPLFIDSWSKMVGEN